MEVRAEHLQIPSQHLSSLKCLDLPIRLFFSPHLFIYLTFILPGKKWVNEFLTCRDDLARSPVTPKTVIIKKKIIILALFEKYEYHFIITLKMQHRYKTTAQFSARSQWGNYSHQDALWLQWQIAFNARWLKVSPMTGNHHFQRLWTCSQW